MKDRIYALFTFDESVVVLGQKTLYPRLVESFRTRKAALSALKIASQGTDNLLFVGKFDFTQIVKWG